MYTYDIYIYIYIMQYTSPMPSVAIRFLKIKYVLIYKSNGKIASFKCDSDKCDSDKCDSDKCDSVAVCVNKCDSVAVCVNRVAIRQT